MKRCGVDYALYMRNKTATAEEPMPPAPVPVAPRYAEALLDVLAPYGSLDRFPRCVEKDGLCGPWFGGRVCRAGQYCSPEGQCRWGMETMGRIAPRMPPPAGHKSTLTTCKAVSPRIFRAASRYRCLTVYITRDTCKPRLNGS